MTRARTLADMISDGVIGTTELADDAITPVKLDETGNYTIAQLDVNGTLTADGLTVDGGTGNYGIEIEARTDFTGISGQLGITDSTGSAILNTVSGNLNISTGATFGTSTGTQRLQIGSGGDISFYDTSDNAKFFWDASEESLTIGPATNTAANLLLTRTGSTEYANTVLEAGRKYQIGSGGASTGDYANKFYIYDNTGGAPRLSLDSSGNFALGTMTPTANGLTIASSVANASNMQFHIGGNSTSPSTGTYDTISNNNHGDLLISSNAYVNSNSNPVIINNHSDMGATGIQIGGNGSHDLRFYTQQASSTAGTEITNAERMRIKAAGDIYIGKTTGSLGTAGTVIYGGSYPGLIESTADNLKVMTLNRENADGGIIDFRKNASQIGEIGVVAGDNLYIGSTASGHTGISFGSNEWTPMSPVGTNADDTVDIGASSRRIRKIFTSQGIFLGGTGSSNQLEDYEEGNWTPTITGGFTGSGLGKYTKVGDIVYVTANLYRPADTSSSTEIQIGGWPFTPASLGHWQLLNVSMRYVNVDEKIVAGVMIDSVSTYHGKILTFSDSGSDYQYLTHSVSTSSYWTFQISGTYKTA